MDWRQMHKHGHLVNKEWNTRFAQQFYDNSRYLMYLVKSGESVAAYKHRLGDLQQGLAKVVSQVTGRSQVQLVLYLYPKY